MEKAILLTLFAIWFLKEYNKNCLNLYLQILQFSQNIIYFLSEYNLYFSGDFFYEEDNIMLEEEQKLQNPQDIIIPPPPLKYEDKYKSELKKLDKEYTLSEKDKILFKNEIINSCKTEIENLTTELQKNKLIYTKLAEESLDTYKKKYFSYNVNGEYNEDHEYEDDEYYEDIKNNDLEEIVDDNNELITKISELKNFINSPEGEKKLEEEANKRGMNYMLCQRLLNLKNCYVFENTPLGNVLMMYDASRETFKYFSDNSIPYRYLEVVGRKYAKQFNVRQIYIDMDEELKLSEENLKKEEEIKKINKMKKDEEIKLKISSEEKKSVFTKFKSYNNESGSGHVITAAPPQNSIPNNRKTSNLGSEKIILKNRLNKYTYEGKIANFNFLKKIKRSVVDKKSSTSFADFKKMRQDQKK
jgi:hypothetical protein